MGCIDVNKWLMRKGFGGESMKGHYLDSFKIIHVAVYQTKLFVISIFVQLEKSPLGTLDTCGLQYRSLPQ